MSFYKGLFILSSLMLLSFQLLSASEPGVRFIENKGQWGDRVIYAADIAGGQVYLTEKGFEYVFYNTDAVHRRHTGYEERADYLPTGNFDESLCDTDMLNMHRFTAEFIGSQRSQIEHKNTYSTIYNYFHGKDPSKWVQRAQAFGNIQYNQLYPEVDLAVYSSGNSLKYDLIVREGGDVTDIHLKYSGVDKIFIENEDLHILTSVNEVIEYRPYAYQIVDGVKQEVFCRFKLQDNEVSFDFPQGYDPCVELVIDPLLIFSTYSGSFADNWGNTATYGENGKLYSGGITNHFRGSEYLGEFPATTGAYQTSWGGIWDVAILKYDSSGQNLEYATYLGGSDSEVPVSMIMNNKEELVILGITNSEDFPVTAGAYQPTFAGGEEVDAISGVYFTNGSDMFIVKLSKDGSRLTGGSYFGGSRSDGLLRIDGPLTKNYGDQQRGEVFIDEDDNIYVTSSTGSTDLFADSAVQSFNRSFGGGYTDALVAKFNTDLSAMLWGGYFGGNADDSGFSVKVRKDGSVYAAGGTESRDFHSTAGGMIDTYIGGIDGWVGLIANSGDSIVTSTYIGTPSYDQIYFLDLDANEDVYLLGQTQGSYPISSGVYSNPGGGQFIHKLNRELSATDFSTAFGTPGRREPNISLTAFLVNDCDNLYVTGWGNNSGNFSRDSYVNLNTMGLPTTEDAIRTATNGQDFYLMVLDSDAKSLLYGTFFGGSGAAIHVDGGTSRFDKRGIVYHSVCASCFGGSDFPTTANAWSNVNNASGGEDVGGCNNAAFKFDLASLRARLQTNSVRLDQPGLTHVCLPDDIVFENFSIGGELYEWTFGDGTGTTLTTKSNVVHSYERPGTYRVVLKAIDNNTCIGQDIATVIVTVSQPQFSVVDDGEICEEDQFQLSASGGISYQWISGDSSFVSNQPNPTVKPEITTTYYVAMIDENGCEGSDTVRVEVIPKVEVDFKVTKQHDCFSRPTVLLENLSGSGDTFEWSLGDGTTSGEDEFVYEYETDGTYNITLTGTREFCVYDKTEQVMVETVKVPNVITPELEGYNDTFVIETSRQVDLSIYNRWSKLLYQEEDYQDDWAGEGLASGVYYYEAVLKEETVCKGWVHLIK